MHEPDSYLTISGPSEGIYREKGSKFLSFAYPAASEELAKSIIERLRKQYHDARHHCYAYKTGFGSLASERSNDDGEPAHSAGPPIMGQIEAFGLHNILVVVVRYFGGILLGVGGLVHAYKTAARDALEKSNRVEIEISDRFIILFGYNDLSLVMRVLHEEGAEITGQEYDSKGSISFSLSRKRQEHCLERLKNIPSPDIRLEKKE